MEKTTFKGELVSKASDFGYITYVFKLLDIQDIKHFDANYMMCVRYPNWNSADINLGEIGYVQTLDVIAGIDKYFKNGQMVPYNYTNTQFLQFVPERKKINKEIRLD